MTQQRVPRRPAMLEPAQAEAIVGDGDPAAYSELAHASAWAVLGLSDQDFPADAPSRVRDLIAREGIDAVAELWARSPEFTLPGALWRIFLFGQWLRRDEDLVEERFNEGLISCDLEMDEYPSHLSELWLSEAEASDPGFAGAADCEGGLVSVAMDRLGITPMAVECMIRQLFAGEFSEDTIDQVFAYSAALMRVIAAGDVTASSWITSPTDPLAYPVSTRARALIRTAEELEQAAAYARAGELD